MQKLNRFSKEFKFEAIRLLKTSGKPAADFARELGIQRNQLFKWQRQLNVKSGDAFPVNRVSGRIYITH